MINMRDAFGSDTTTKLEYFQYEEGHWDADNNWVDDSYVGPTIIDGTPIPIGERQTGTHGENLVPSKLGERNPASMKFTCQQELHLKDVILYRGIAYKISRKGDYNAAGFFTSVGITLRSFFIDDNGNYVAEEP